MLDAKDWVRLCATLLYENNYNNRLRLKENFNNKGLQIYWICISAKALVSPMLHYVNVNM